MSSTPIATIARPPARYEMARRRIDRFRGISSAGITNRALLGANEPANRFQSERNGNRLAGTNARLAEAGINRRCERLLFINSSPPSPSWHSAAPYGHRYWWYQAGHVPATP